MTSAESPTTTIRRFRARILALIVARPRIGSTADAGSQGEILAAEKALIERPRIVPSTVLPHAALFLAFEFSSDFSRRLVR